MRIALLVSHNHTTFQGADFIPMICGAGYLVHDFVMYQIRPLTAAIAAQYAAEFIALHEAQRAVLHRPPGKNREKLHNRSVQYIAAKWQSFHAA